MGTLDESLERDPFAVGDEASVAAVHREGEAVRIRPGARGGDEDVDDAVGGDGDGRLTPRGDRKAEKWKQN
jgi:hypothetical protein